jgi:hypothetical protein
VINVYSVIEGWRGVLDAKTDRDRIEHAACRLRRFMTENRRAQAHPCEAEKSVCHERNGCDVCRTHRYGGAGEGSSSIAQCSFAELWGTAFIGGDRRAYQEVSSLHRCTRGHLGPIGSELSLRACACGRTTRTTVCRGLRRIARRSGGRHREHNNRQQRGRHFSEEHVYILARGGELVDAKQCGVLFAPIAVYIFKGPGEAGRKRPARG